ncbi:hypothetical protein WJX82_005811 [Trebouxia sp. C0006]
MSQMTLGDASVTYGSPISCSCLEFHHRDHQATDVREAARICLSCACHDGLRQGDPRKVDVQQGNVAGERHFKPCLPRGPI